MSLTTDLLPQVMDFCRTEHVRFLIARCSTHELSTAQAMENLGFNLMDTLVYYRRNLDGQALPERGNIPTRPVAPEDVEKIRQIARNAFRGYSSHYHADPRLDRKVCDDIYVDWAVRSCSQKDMADQMLVADSRDEVQGFLTLKILETRDADGKLFAVDPKAQGHGVGQALLAEGLYWCREQGMRGMIISTQINNLASQVSWVRVGFTPYQSFYTFHKWFDEKKI